MKTEAMWNGTSWLKFEDHQVGFVGMDYSDVTSITPEGVLIAREALAGMTHAIVGSFHPSALEINARRPQVIMYRASEPTEVCYARSRVNMDHVTVDFGLCERAIQRRNRRNATNKAPPRRKGNPKRLARVAFDRDIVAKAKAWRAANKGYANQGVA